MSTAIVLQEQETSSLQPRSFASIVAQRAQISNLMSQAMVKDIDYGTIPGTPKPTLYKPGSEKLLSMFHLAAQPVVEDLSTPDVMRFRVFVRITESGSGRYLGEGVGEASSAEQKYKWRGIVCEEEWQMTPEDRRRVLWKKGRQGSAAYPVKQVRTDMEDLANTVLKMAKKRAQIDAVLTVTAASDVFMQDAQELQDAGVDIGDESTGQQEPQRPTTLQPKQQPASQQQAATTSQPAQQQRPAQQQPTQQAATVSNGGPTISEPQARRFYFFARRSGFTNDQIDEYLHGTLGVARKEDITKAQYEDACTWAQGE
jgi:hypothetical protein